MKTLATLLLLIPFNVFAFDYFTPRTVTNIEDPDGSGFWSAIQLEAHTPDAWCEYSPNISFLPTFYVGLYATGWSVCEDGPTRPSTLWQISTFIMSDSQDLAADGWVMPATGDRTVFLVKHLVGTGIKGLTHVQFPFHTSIEQDFTGTADWTASEHRHSVVAHENAHTAINWLTNGAQIAHLWWSEAVSEHLSHKIVGHDRLFMATNSPWPDRLIDGLGNSPTSPLHRYQLSLFLDLIEGDPDFTVYDWLSAYLDDLLVADPIKDWQTIALAMREPGGAPIRLARTWGIHVHRYNTRDDFYPELAELPPYVWDVLTPDLFPGVTYGLPGLTQTTIEFEGPINGWARIQAQLPQRCPNPIFGTIRLYDGTTGNLLGDMDLSGGIATQNFYDLPAGPILMTSSSLDGTLYLPRVSIAYSDDTGDIFSVPDATEGDPWPRRRPDGSCQ